MATLDPEELARIAAAFRDANESIEAVADEVAALEKFPVICECADTTCLLVMHVSRDDYEHARGGGAVFINARGHERPFAHVLRVVAERDNYVLVEKLGRAAEVSEQLDPRREPH